MWGRRCIYLGALAGSFLFYLWYREWLSWLLLMWVLALPAISLLVSLPAMCTVRFRLSCSPRAQLGETVKPELKTACRMPPPLVGCRFQVVHAISDDRYLYEMGERLLTDHCGVYHIRIWRLWVYDYMGLFRRRIRNVPQCTMTVEPASTPMENTPRFDRGLGDTAGSRPGSSPEHYELRLYHPGDPLNQIHWKLVAKTGKLIVREHQEARAGKVCLALVLPSKPEQADQRLGQLLWLSRIFLDNGMPYEIRCLTDRGLECFPVSDDSTLREALDTVMGAHGAPEGACLPEMTEAGWVCRIGGEPDEA